MAKKMFWILVAGKGSGFTTRNRSFRMSEKGALGVAMAGLPILFSLLDP